MGNCTSKSSAKDVVSTPRKDELKEGAFKYNKDNRKVVYVGDDNRDDNLTTRASMSASASMTSEEGSPPNTGRDSASKKSLLFEIREYLEDDVSTQVTAERRGSPNQNNNSNQYKDSAADASSVSKERDGSVLEISPNPSIISPLPFDEALQTDRSHEEERNDVNIMINDLETKSQDSSLDHLTIEGDTLVDGQLGESYKKAQALLGEVRREREKSKKMKGQEGTQCVEVINISETDDAESVISDYPQPTPESASGIFSYDTMMECEEEAYWREMQSGNESPNPSQKSNEEFIFKEEENMISEEVSQDSNTIVSPHNAIYSNDNLDQDHHLKKHTLQKAPTIDTLQTAPTTETEAESLDEIIGNGEENNNNYSAEDDDNDDSVDTSEWSESMSELIKLCEEESIPKGEEGGVASPASDRQAILSPTTKSVDTVAQLQNIPEYSSPNMSASEKENSVIPMEDRKADEDQSDKSPSIPATLKISEDDLVSLNCSPLTAPQDFTLAAEDPTKETSRTMIGENVADDSTSYINNKAMTANKTDAKLTSKSSVITMEENSVISEAPSSSTMNLASTLVPEETSTISHFDTVTKSAPTINKELVADPIVNETLSKIDVTTNSTLVVEGNSLVEERVSHSLNVNAEQTTRAEEITESTAMNNEGNLSSKAPSLPLSSEILNETIGSEVQTIARSRDDVEETAGMEGVTESTDIIGKSNRIPEATPLPPSSAILTLADENHSETTTVSKGKAIACSLDDAEETEGEEDRIESTNRIDESNRPSEATSLPPLNGFFMANRDLSETSTGSKEKETLYSLDDMKEETEIVESTVTINEFTIVSEVTSSLHPSNSIMEMANGNLSGKTTLKGNLYEEPGKVTRVTEDVSITSDTLISLSSESGKEDNSMISELLSLAPTVITEGNLAVSESPYFFSPILDTKSSTQNYSTQSTLEVDPVDSPASAQQFDSQQRMQVSPRDSKLQRPSPKALLTSMARKKVEDSNGSKISARSKKKQLARSSTPTSNSSSRRSTGSMSKQSPRRKISGNTGKSPSKKINNSVVGKSQSRKTNSTRTSKSPLQKRNVEMVGKSPIQKKRTDDDNIKPLSRTPIARKRPTAIPTVMSPITVKSPLQSPYKKSTRHSSIPSVSSQSVTPSTRRRGLESPVSCSKIQNCNNGSGVPLQILTSEETPGGMSLDTNCTTPVSRPWDEISTSASRTTMAMRCTSPVESLVESVLSSRSTSSMQLGERQRATQDRISQYKSPRACDNRWNPNLTRTKRACARCYSLASEKEKDRFEMNGHSTTIVLTSGGCANRNCSQFYCRDDDEGVILCRICFNAVHRPTTLLVEEVCRSLEYS